MADTTPRGQAVLLARFPELAAYARPALRLHPRRGRPLVGQSSVGGPLLWPATEPWPTCDADDHELPGGRPGSFGEPVVMASVLQLRRRDLPAGVLPEPGWAFPGDTDVLQVLWCPNPHGSDYGPSVRVFWRTEAEIGARLPANPPLNRTAEDRGGDNLTPRACHVHPELVVDFPPVMVSYAGDVFGDSDADFLEGVLPPELEWACIAWTVDGLPRARNDDDREYPRVARAPGWRLGGWIRGCDPRPPDRCGCGAPLFSLLDTTFEGLDGPWRPVAEPEFPWADPEDEEWGGSRPPGIWGGRHGELWLLACSADASHPVVAGVE